MVGRRKILITGSSGMLGTELVEVLRGDHEITGVDVVRPQTGDLGPQTFYEAGITDAGNIKKIFDKEKPELVIHAAAWTDVDGCEKDPEKAYDVNVLGTENVARCAAAGKTSLVFISTDFVFDGEKGEPYTEEDQPRQISVYGRSKREAERAVERTLSGYIIVRTSWLYGRNGRNFVDTIIGAGKKERRLRVVDDQIGSPTYAKDLARALEKTVIQSDISGKDIFHVSNAGRCSWREFTVWIFSNIEGMENIIIDPITSEDLGRPAKRPGFSVLDNGKFETAFGYGLRPWQEALEEYLRERHA